MQPDSSEERQARDVQHVRRLLGFPADHVDARLDALCVEALQHCHHFDTCAEYVKARLRPPVQ